MPFVGDSLICVLFFGLFGHVQHLLLSISVTTGLLHEDEQENNTNEVFDGKKVERACEAEVFGTHQELHGENLLHATCIEAKHDQTSSCIDSALRDVKPSHWAARQAETEDKGIQAGVHGRWQGRLEEGAGSKFHKSHHSMTEDEHGFATEFVHRKNSENAAGKVSDAADDSGGVSRDVESAEVLYNVHQSVHVDIDCVETSLHVENRDDKANPSGPSVERVANSVSEGNFGDILV